MQFIKRDSGEIAQVIEANQYKPGQPLPPGLCGMSIKGIPNCTKGWSCLHVHVIDGASERAIEVYPGDYLVPNADGRIRPHGWARFEKEHQIYTPKPKRPSWDEYFLEMARVVSTRATCDRLHVGSVIVKERHPIATGYNGAAPGLDHCDDVGHLLHEINGRKSCQRATHAEQNAINTAAKFGHATKGATIYVTDQPCLNCAKAIITAGIVEVVYARAYAEQTGLEFLAQAGLKVRQIGATT